MAGELGQVDPELEDDSERPRIGRLAMLGETPPANLRGITPPAETSTATATPAEPAAKPTSAPLRKAQIPPTGLDTTATRDQNELERLSNSGSGVRQIAKAHPVAGGFLRGLDVLGSIAAPNITRRIPGTELHHEDLLNQQRKAVSGDVAEQEKEAQTEEQKSAAGKNTAETAAIENPQPKPKEEEWSVIPGMTGPNGEVVQQEKNSGQIRFAPGLSGVGPLKEPAQKAAHVTYDSGIPVSVTDKSGNTFDVNDPKLPPELKPLVDAATRAHGQHVSEEATKQANAQAATLGRLDKTENFQKQEKGREHITKIEDAYRDASSKADLIRDAITAAQNGNKQAAAFQGMLATLGITTMEGVKRINAVELGIPTGAGSLWDRTKNKLGQWTAGQPMDADLQADLGHLADLIENASYKNYTTKHAQLKKRYELDDEEPLPAPQGGAGTGENGRPNGATMKVPGSDGKLHWSDGKNDLGIVAP